jgi:acyl-CoA synthetase (AMP-forming)/AMP-acid ligase II
MSPASFLLNPIRWLKAVNDYRGTLTGGPNFAYDLCARAITAEQRASLDVSSLRIAFNGAEPIRQSTLDRFSALLAESGFRSEAWLSAFGLAESTLMVSGRWARKMSQTPSSLVFSSAALRENRVVLAAGNATTDETITLVNTGAVLPEHEIAIVDPHTLQRCEDDRVGEIWVSGPCVAKGYWRRPELSCPWLNPQ